MGRANRHLSAVALGVGPLRRFGEGHDLELSQQAVEFGARLAMDGSDSSASSRTAAAASRGPDFCLGSSVRTSKIEIIGSTRTNRNIRVVNSPMVPKSVMKSQIVG
jgi:hypothetical protein